MGIVLLYVVIMSSDFDSNYVIYRLVWFVLHLPLFRLTLIVIIRIDKNLMTYGFKHFKCKQT